MLGARGRHPRFHPRHILRAGGNSLKADRRGATILIADDLSFMRMIQKDILSERGYTVVGEASDGRQAVEKYQTLRPDLVVLDITMPNMNGLDAMRRIFEIDPKARVIMCSALGQQNLIVEAIRAGVRDFIVKPFKAERILSAIEKALRT